MDVLEVQASQEVSLEECKRASLKNEYVAGDGKVLRVTPGVISVCQGRLHNRQQL